MLRGDGRSTLTARRPARGVGTPTRAARAADWAGPPGPACLGAKRRPTDRSWAGTLGAAGRQTRRMAGRPGAPRVCRGPHPASRRPGKRARGARLRGRGAHGWLRGGVSGHQMELTCSASASGSHEHAHIIKAGHWIDAGNLASLRSACCVLCVTWRGCAGHGGPGSHARHARGHGARGPDHGSARRGHRRRSWHRDWHGGGVRMRVRHTPAPPLRPRHRQLRQGRCGACSHQSSLHGAKAVHDAIRLPCSHAKEHAG